MPSATTPFAPGVVLVLAEPDYCYGRGELMLRVQQIGADPGSLSKLEWLRVVGTQIHWNGADGEERDVMVRVATIARSVRPAGWLPSPQR